jgi:hypothetical protein
MYHPDRVFMARLKKIDKRLGCHYEMIHGHFVITFKRATGDPVPLFMVKTDDGDFRHPDQRDINTLMESDLRKESPRERMIKASKYMSDYREKKRKQAHDLFHGLTRDDRRQLMPAFAKLTKDGKFNSTFRRIVPKPRGIVYK